MDPGVVWSAVGALGAVAAAVVAAWAARQSRISAEHANAAAETLATIERDRRHAELTPQFQVTVDDGGSGNRDRLVLLMRLTGPPGLDQLGGLTVRIRDDNYRRWVGELPVGATREQVENCIWGPYRLVPGLGSDDGRADKTGRFAQYDAALPIGEDVAYPIVSNRGTGGRSCCGVGGLGMAELPSAACGGMAWAGFAGLRIAGVTGRDPDRWRDDGGRVLGVSRAGRGPGRLRPGRCRRCGRIRAGSRSAC